MTVTRSATRCPASDAEPDLRLRIVLRATRVDDDRNSPATAAACHDARDGWKPRLADWAIAIGALPRGRTNSVLDVPGVGLGHATVSPMTPTRPRARVSPAPASRCSTPAATLCRAGARRGVGAQRRGRADGTLRGRGMGRRREPGLPDLDHAGRSGLRRGMPPADGRTAADRCRRRGDPGRG